ncbi:hypothetical protein [Arenimonas composti]|uniref:Uncharacterized protein n=1 Tax=Arenimonas composti TR7-09 = DSM 18010 TaxID=1121013 RepID=A0A091BB27_9GAMM|nr:hypothetical protein [Arenimonas composti]KFN48717.1 hypothetical protein P873_13755 [Arenimonas composti TR7-09 = DSM 18010]
MPTPVTPALSRARQIAITVADVEATCAAPLSGHALWIGFLRAIPLALLLSASPVTAHAGSEPPPTPLPERVPADECPVLEGRWQSDRERTMAWIDRHLQMNAELKGMVREMSGRAVLEIGADTITARIDAWTLAIGEVQVPMEATELAWRYELVHCTRRVVVTRQPQAQTGEEQVVVYHFEAPDLMWTYSGGADSESPDSAQREYYTRIRDVHR